MIDMWKGKPLIEMSRDELVIALQEFGKFHRDMVAHQQQHIQFLMNTPKKPLSAWQQLEASGMAGMNDDAIYRTHAAARNFLRFYNDRSYWQRQIVRWCIGYKACHYLEILQIAVEDFNDRS